MRNPSATSRRLSRSPSAMSKISNFFSHLTRTLNVNTSPLTAKIANGEIRDEGHGILKEFWPKVSKRARASRKARQALARVTDPVYQAELGRYMAIPLEKVDPIPRSSMESDTESALDDKEESAAEAETMVDTVVDKQVEAEAGAEAVAEAGAEAKAEAGAEATTDANTAVDVDLESEPPLDVNMKFEVDYKPQEVKDAEAKGKSKFNLGVKGMFSKIVPAVKKIFGKRKLPVKPLEPPIFPQRVPSASREPFIKPEYSQLEAIHAGFERLLLEMPVYAKPRVGFRAKTCPGFRKDLREMYLVMFDYTSDLDYVAKAAGQKCRKIGDATYDAYLFRDKVFEFYDSIKYQLKLMQYAQELCFYYKNAGCTDEEALKLAQDFSEWKSGFLDYELLMHQYPALFKEANRDIKEANEYSERLTTHLSISKTMEETFSKMKRKFGYRKSLKKRYLDRLSEYFDELQEAFVGSMAYEMVEEFVEYVDRANRDLFESLKKLNQILNIISLIHESNDVTDRYMYRLLRDKDLC